MTTSQRLPAVIIKTTQRLWESIKKHHRNCLNKLFVDNYQTLPDGQPDTLWVTRLTPELKHQARLHYSVIRFGDLLDWTDKELGINILKFYHVI